MSYMINRISQIIKIMCICIYTY